MDAAARMVEAITVAGTAAAGMEADGTMADGAIAVGDGAAFTGLLRLWLSLSRTRIPVATAIRIRTIPRST